MVSPENQPTRTDADAYETQALKFHHHLFLHFDINETILIGDEAGGDTREDCIHKVLAKSAFVRIPTKESDGNTHTVVPLYWWDGSPIQEKYSYDATAKTPALVPDWIWPDGSCPYYRTSYKKRAKTFVEHHGSIYRATYDALQAELSQLDAQIHPVLAHMIPSFFETLRKLCQRSQTWTLVLRTFGSDLVRIADAITGFAQGQHPQYPDFNEKRLIISPDCLYQGRWKSTDDETCTYQLWQGDQLIAADENAILDLLQLHSICGIQDDYSFWDAHDCHPSAGKPVWMTNPSDSMAQQHLLMDDNIHNLANDSIACVRYRNHDDSQWSSLNGSEMLAQHGVHLIRVPTVETILQRDWFLSQIDAAQRRWAGQKGQRDSRPAHFK